MGAAPILVVLRDGEMIQSHPIEGEADLGRAEGCVIRLDDRAVSRHHAVLRPLPDGIQIEKKSEFGPVLVNGADTAKAVLKEGDVISIGPFLMKVSVPKDAARPEPTKEDHALDTVGVPSVTTDLLTEQSGSEPLEVPDALSLDSLAFGEEVGNTSTPEAGSEVQGASAVSLEFEGLEAPDADDVANETPAEDLGQMVDDDARTKLTPVAKLAVKLIFKPGAANHSEYELTKDEISIGRGKNCDIVLDDKKSSRKNCIIRRAGLNFMIKDLDSANGTFVNGVRIQERELAGDDVIKVGKTEFVFKAVSLDYQKREKDFMLLPQTIEEEPQEELLDPGLPATGAAGDVVNPFLSQSDVVPGAMHGAISGTIPGLTGVSGAGGKRTLVEKFKALPKRTQVMVVIVGIVFAYWFFDESDETPQETKQAGKKPVATASAVPAGPATFDTLRPEQKRFVEAQHSLSFDHYRNKDYDKALFEIGKIHELIPEFRDSREIERYAKEGKRKLEAIEDERRKKEEEARLQARIASIVDEARVRMSKRQYEQAREIFSEILSLDPGNIPVANWQKEIEDFEEQQRIKQQAALVRKQINHQAAEVYSEAVALKKHGKFHSAIERFGKVADTGTDDKKLIAKANAGIAESRVAIRALFDPVMEEARAAEQAGENAKAYKLYEKAASIDPPSRREPLKGMDRIYGMLRERARVLYTEGVLYESYSDFTSARKKFTECMQIAPERDDYYDKAKRKLSRYPSSDTTAQ